MNENDLSEKIIGCCIRVHKILGPGLLESVYEKALIYELAKSVDKLSPLHHKQLLTCLKLTHLKLGLLINFNVILIKDGIKRIANNL